MNKCVSFNPFCILLDYTQYQEYENVFLKFNNEGKVVMHKTWQIIRFRLITILLFYLFKTVFELSLFKIRFALNWIV